jgi:hypothetical protein
MTTALPPPARFALSFCLLLVPVANTWAQAPAASAELLPGPVSQWTAAPGSNGHYYQAVAAPGGILWKDAQAWALARGGYLATLGSEAENDFVFKLIDSPRYWGVGGPYGTGPFLGGAETATKPGWQWANNEGTFSFNKWAPTQPNNPESERRLQFISDGKGAKRQKLWNDLPATDKQYGFVVEYASPAKAAPAAATNRSLDLLFAARFALMEGLGEMHQSTDNRGSFRQRSLDSFQAAIAEVTLAINFAVARPAEAELAGPSPDLFVTIGELLGRPINKNQGRPIRAMAAIKSSLGEMQKLPGNVGGYRQRILKTMEKTAQDILAGANYLDQFPDNKT